MDDDYDEEPTTRLSSAFFVVLVLHLVAIGGVWAFNSIKAHRRETDTAPKAAVQKAVPDQPAPAAQVAATTETPVPAEPKPQPLPVMPLVAPLVANSKTYTVKQGDNLTKIAASQGVSVAEIQLANQAKDIAILRPGQIIHVPARKAAERAPAAESRKVEEQPAKRTYAVQKGDTAISIARRFGVTVEDLLKVNKVSDPKKLQLGQSLKVPAKKMN